MPSQPEPEIEISRALVTQLLEEQFPELLRHELIPLSHGWDNTMWRLGDDAMVRVPHRQASATLIENEQRWLPALAERLDLPIPAPTHLGRPSTSFPWHWSVVPFVRGEEAATAPLDDPAVTAQRLGRFLAQLHTPAPVEAPENPFRGCPLTDRAESFRANIARISHRRDLDVRQLVDRFEHACDLDVSSEQVWLHGDLHTRNMVVTNGVLSAVIDWGDITSGDRAVDLTSAFMLVPQHLDIVKDHAGADEPAWNRASGWAANFAAIYLAFSDDNPVMEQIGVELAHTLGA